jgi:cephalosporin hydroxylase
MLTGSPWRIGYAFRWLVERKFVSWGADWITNNFHRLYYFAPGRTWRNTYWFGVPVQKCPLDLWIYQEILQEIRPSLIIETGTHRGGSALFLAGMCDLIGSGRILTIDIEVMEPRREHPRITYLEGSSTAPEILEQVRSHIEPDDSVLVILDSDHSLHHVSRELNSYSELVTPGSYLLVEDTNLNGHPIASPLPQPGPMEVVEAFLRTNESFVPDREREKFFLTFNPKGYLRRLA